MTQPPSYDTSYKALLLDERRLQQHPLPEVKNFADAVFRLEASRQIPEVLAVVRALGEVLRTPRLQTVRRAFNQWIKAFVVAPPSHTFYL